MNYETKLNNLKKQVKKKFPVKKAYKQAMTSFGNTDKLKVTIGNKKIGTDTLIFNFGPALECPAAIRGMCDMAHKSLGGNGKCYALKAERLYNNSWVFRRIQRIQWKTWTAEKIAGDMISVITSRTKNMIKFVRLNESGDFENFEDIKKLSAVAKIVDKAIPGIKFYTYTHRKDLRTKFLTLPGNVTINGSNFKIHNEYHVNNIIPSEIKPELAKNQMVCLDDCSTCNLCKIQHGNEILQTVH